MPGTTTVKQPSRGSVVKVRIAAEEVPRFSVGSTWKVVSTSLESLWQGWYTVALEEVEEGVE